MSIGRAQMAKELTGNRMKKRVYKKKGGGLNPKAMFGGILGAAMAGDPKGAIPGIAGMVADKAGSAKTPPPAPAPAPAAAKPQRPKKGGPLLRDSMMKSGGMVSKKAGGGKVGGRGDGCAVRGRTKGTMR